MKIGQLAAEAGVSVDTVRFYERRGVLPAPQRRPSGYRDYPPATVERIRMARSLQQLGFTLDEVIDALRAHDTGAATCDSERWRLDAVLDRIDVKIAELRRTRRLVTATMRECQSGNCRFASGATSGAVTGPAAGVASRRSSARAPGRRRTGGPAMPPVR